MRNKKFKRVMNKLYTIIICKRNFLYPYQKLSAFINLRRRIVPGGKHFTVAGLKFSASVLNKHHKFSLAIVNLQPFTFNFPPVG